MKEDLKLLSEEIQVIQKEYENYALNIEQRIDKFKIEGNELLCELKAEVAKTDEVLYLLGDRLKKGTAIFEQIKNLDDKILASDILTMLKDTCMDFKDFAINHNALTKGKAQVIMDKNMDYMETVQTAVDFQATITGKFQARMELQTKIEQEKDRLGRL